VVIRERRSGERQAGYSLVFLIVFVSLLSVAAAAVLPAIKKQIEREKEAELIFRGLQYAEAIRVFQQRFGRYPNALQELLELEPRSIRQLWTDPMTKDGRWALILASGNQSQDGAGEGGADDQGRDLAGASAPAARSRPGTAGTGQLNPGGPILGVVSRKKGVATRTFLGNDHYEKWRFTADILPKPMVIPGSEMVSGGSVENLGKPFPRGLQPVGLAPQGGETNLVGGEGPTDAFDDEGDDG
jgi:type II secretory pathway pseudopilin PulG